MSNAFFELGREGFADGSIDWDTDTIKIMAMDIDDVDAAVKAITGATNASPIVITATSHGFSNGDIVAIQKVGGNTAANNRWTIANVAANTFELSGSTGNAAYTSGGVAVCMGPSTVGKFIADLSAGRVGTDQTLGSKTVAAGVLDAADPTWTSLTGDQLETFVIYKDTGSEATSRTILFLDGKHVVTCNTTAAALATSIPVEPLVAAIASGAVLVFSNGASATLSGAAAAGDRSIAVNALAANVTAGSFATADASGSGLPFTPNGGNLGLTFDNGANKIAKL